jgi:hypothetical protein
VAQVFNLCTENFQSTIICIFIGQIEIFNEAGSEEIFDGDNKETK